MQIIKKRPRKSVGYKLGNISFGEIEHRRLMNSNGYEIHVYNPYTKKVCDIITASEYKNKKHEVKESWNGAKAVISSFNRKGLEKQQPEYLTQSDISKLYDIESCRLADLRKLKLLTPHKKDGRVYLYKRKDVEDASKHLEALSRKNCGKRFRDM